MDKSLALCIRLDVDIEDVDVPKILSVLEQFGDVELLDAEIVEDIAEDTDDSTDVSPDDAPDSTDQE